ncbi:hypothetical protein ABZ801_02465 [Actinomadura sp. NPDC047616]|uniref:hypothetical protein n=1 Tax=Actinomadura sp. NPDC047616 TaxID=3155914 RepID=UPI0033E31866
MENNLDTLVIALYVKIDDDAAGIARLPGRPPKLSHAELLCLAVMQAMLGFTSEARWLRHVRVHLGHLFPFVPQQPGYNKRLRAALPRIKRIIRTLAADTGFWHDTVWIADQWIAHDPRTRSWFVTRDVAARPRSGADEEVWRRAGSPRRWRLNQQGVSQSPIEGQDLVTNGEWAAAVPGDPGGRGLYLGNWWASVRDVQGLPADPARLRARIVAKSDGSRDMFDPSTSKNPDTLAFQVGARLLMDVPVAPKVRAATYRMLAELPRVRSLGRLRDPLGRPGVGVAMTEAGPDGSTVERQLIIDPGTGLLLADQKMVVRPGGSGLRPGWRVSYSARQDAGWTNTEPVLPEINCAASSAPARCR